MRRWINSTNAKDIGVLYIICVVVLGMIIGLIVGLNYGVKGIKSISIIGITVMLLVFSKRLGSRIRELKIWWDNTLLGIEFQDPMGNLLPESYKKRRNSWLGGHFVVIVAVTYMISRYIVRITKELDFIVLPAGVMILGFLIIVGVQYKEAMEYRMMIRTYRENKRQGLYGEQGRGTGRGIGPDKLRLVLQGLKIAGGAFIGLGAGIAAGNEVGRAFGHEKVVTESLEGVTKRMGLHKEVLEESRRLRLEREANRNMNPGLEEIKRELGKK